MPSGENRGRVTDSLTGVISSRRRRCQIDQIQLRMILPLIGDGQRGSVRRPVKLARAVGSGLAPGNPDGHAAGPAHSINRVNVRTFQRPRKPAHSNRATMRPDPAPPVRRSRSPGAARLAANAPATSDGRPPEPGTDRISTVRRVKSTGCLPALAEKPWGGPSCVQNPRCPKDCETNRQRQGTQPEPAAAANASQMVMGRLDVCCATAVSLSATCRAVGRSSARSGEHRRDQAVKRCRQIGAERRRAAALPLRLSPAKARDVLAESIRVTAGCQLVEDHAEREDVACLRGRLSQAPLGRQITQRSCELRPACLLGCASSARPKSSSLI